MCVGRGGGGEGGGGPLCNVYVLAVSVRFIVMKPESVEQIYQSL